MKQRQVLIEKDGMAFVLTYTGNPYEYYELSVYECMQSFTIL
jgi:hypothetical protein